MTLFKDLRYLLCHFQFWGENIWPPFPKPFMWFTEADALDSCEQLRRPEWPWGPEHWPPSPSSALSSHLGSGHANLVKTQVSSFKFTQFPAAYKHSAPTTCFCVNNQIRWEKVDNTIKYIIDGFSSRHSGSLLYFILFLFYCGKRHIT